MFVLRGGMMNQIRLNNSIKNIDRQYQCINMLLNTKDSRKWEKDMFELASAQNRDLSDSIGLYKCSVVQKVSNIVPDRILDMINFNYSECFKNNNSQDEDGFFIDGVKYPYSAFQSVSLDRCLDIEADDNTIVFENGNYYKFADEEGNIHIMACDTNNMEQPASDIFRNARDFVSQRMTLFWNLLAFDTTYINEYFSQEEQIRFLSDAGVKEGFFTVKVGDKVREYYFSKSLSNLNIIARDLYDYRYYGMVEEGSWFHNYKAGAVFKVGGKEYTLNEDSTLDIPYGENIYDFEYPPKS